MYCNVANECPLPKSTTHLSLQVALLVQLQYHTHRKHHPIHMYVHMLTYKFEASMQALLAAQKCIGGSEVASFPGSPLSVQ